MILIVGSPKLANQRKIGRSARDGEVIVMMFFWMLQSFGNSNSHVANDL